MSGAQNETHPLFKVHRLNGTGMDRAKGLAAKFTELLRFIEETAGKESRELSIAKTHLETASFFAKKAMAQNPDNQET